MRVAVTGVAGNVGSHVVRELAAHGHEIVGVDIREPTGYALASFHAADTQDLDALTRAFVECEAVIHLAAISRPGLVPDAELFRINVISTFNALEAATASGARRFVMASSEAALGFAASAPEVHPDYVPIDEDHPVHPRDAYGLSKVLCEQMCRSYSRRGALSTICLRTCYVWSLDWRENALDALVNEERARRALWSYVDARDAAVAYRLACEVPEITNETLFVVAADTASMHPTAELLVRFHPETELRAPVGEHGAVVSGDRAREVLGFNPRHTWRDQLAPQDLPSG
jgi:nucleoside-diphosphate-sugar epimerase